MLSKKDIFHEIGKGICIYPLNIDNIKENSINVTVSEYAWTTNTGTVCWYGSNKFHLEGIQADGGTAKKRWSFHKGNSAIMTVKENNEEKRYLIMLPHCTTIIETLEVVGLGSYIGGAVHSKVGIVAKGVGDTGTMLGPGYCGHLMLSLHNITDDVIALPIDSTCVSLTFDYLHTPVERTSLTTPSHYDKLLRLGMRLSEKAERYFNQDWKGNLQGIRGKMKGMPEYTDFRNTYREYSLAAFKKWFSVKRVFLIIGLIGMVVGLGIWAHVADKKLSIPVWEDRFWTIFVASLLGVFLPKTIGKLFDA